MTLQTTKAQAADDRDILFETGLPWIDAATFTPLVGDAVSLNVVHDIGNLVEPQIFDTKISDTQNRVKYLISDMATAPVGRTSNRAGDVFTINSTDYEVVTIDERNNYHLTCLVMEKV